MRRFKPPKPKAIPKRAKEHISNTLHTELTGKIQDLQTHKDAVELESNLYQLFRLGVITEDEYVSWYEEILDVCKKNNWAMP